MKAWHLEQGIYTVRALQPVIREYGYHVAIGGSLVNKGYSEKDLDLYFLPMGGLKEHEPSEPDKLLAYLVSIWGEARPIGRDVETPRTPVGIIPQRIANPVGLAARMADVAIQAQNARVPRARPMFVNPDALIDPHRDIAVAPWDDEPDANRDEGAPEGAQDVGFREIARQEREAAMRQREAQYIARHRERNIGHWNPEPNDENVGQFGVVFAGNVPIAGMPNPGEPELHDIVFKKDLVAKEQDDYDPDTTGIYKHVVTFYRNGDERIDCFIF